MITDKKQQSGKFIGTLLRWLALSLLFVGTHALAQSTGTVTYVYTDPQGTPLAEADASGNITATFEYTPYGTYAPQGTSTPGSVPKGPGYTGHVNDPETNLVYMQARYYDPATGRFLSTDPIAPTPADNFNFNRYVYVENNPVTGIDPTGKYQQNLTASQIDCEIYGGGQNCGTSTSGGSGQQSNGQGGAKNSSSQTASWQWVAVGFSNALCDLGIQASCPENDNVPVPVPSNGSEAKLVSAGGFLANLGMAVISEGETTELTAAHLGIVGDVQELRGTISMQRRVMTVRVDMIRGNIKNPLSVIKNLTALAEKSGASKLRIEGSVANEGLYNILSKRYGMTTSGATDSITINIKH